MRFLLLIIACIFYAPSVHAYVPNMVVQESLDDITLISDPTLAQGFFGSLEGFPQTYEIHASEAFTLYAQIRTPDLSTNTNTAAGIVIKEQKRGVSEVTRMHAEDASWTSIRDVLTGSRYRVGATFEQDLDPGVYRIEVHTPNNAEKYVLMVGKRTDMTIGYFALLGRLIDIQRFNERSAVWVLTSPYVYAPLIVMVVGGVGIWWYRRRRKGT